VTDELFASFDYDGDGKVTINEFDANLKDKTRKAIEEKLKSGFVFDKAKWQAGAKPPTAGPVGMTVGRAFMQFDVDGNGSLDLDELKRGTQARDLCKPCKPCELCDCACTRVVPAAPQLPPPPPNGAPAAFAPAAAAAIATLFSP
jgi:hypothetical protein